MRMYHTMITSRINDDFVIVETEGNKFDATAAKTFRNEVAKNLLTHDKFIICLTGITFMDSTGLGALVWILKKLREKYDEPFLCLVGVNLEIMRLLKLVKMDKVFIHSENIQSAMDLYLNINEEKQKDVF